MSRSSKLLSGFQRNESEEWVRGDSPFSGIDKLES